MNNRRTISSSERPQWRRVLRRRGTGAIAGIALMAGVVGVSGAGAVGATAAATTADGPTAAEHAVAWLATQFDAGIPIQNFGSPDWGVTLDATLGMVATGSGGAQVDAAWAALLADRESAVAPGGVDSPGRLARAILLAAALGEDPRAVGAAPGADLVARLEATRRTTGADAGLFGSGDPTYDGAFRQGYAIAALVAAGATPDPSSISWLLAQQCGPDGDPGAWMPYRSDLSVPCAPNPALFVAPDTNATAAALTGLSATGQGATAIDAALGWLDTVQESDGGWGQQVGYGTDPNSTALVLQALIAVDAADDPRFADQGAGPLAALLSFQLGCDAPEADRGAFTFPGSNEAPNGFATAQAIAPAAGVSVPFTGGPVAPGVTPLDCTPATTTTTTTTTVPGSTTSVPASTTSTPGSTSSTVPAPQVAGERQVADDQAPRSLAPTGAGSWALGGLGLGSVLAGTALVAGSRRRIGG